MCIDWQNKTDFEIADTFLELLESILESVLQHLHLSPKGCELLLVNNAEIAGLNAQFRGIEEATDVLSFPLDAHFAPILGSIVISVEYARQVSSSLKHSLEDEIALLFIHGLLHLLGFDHERDNGEQRNLEAQLVLQFSLPHSLIVRNGEEKC